jgi:hypothetical protein
MSVSNTIALMRGEAYSSLVLKLDTPTALTRPSLQHCANSRPIASKLWKPTFAWIYRSHQH